MKTSTPFPKDWREGRRLRAWALHEQGWKHKDIAAALGVTEGAVSQWINKGKAAGPAALCHHPSPGAPPKLRPEQLAHLPELLARGAEAFGFRGQVWTAARVAQVIKREFGVRYHPTHCGRLLSAIKHSRQKPETRAPAR
jgi:transposase